MSDKLIGAHVEAHLYRFQFERAEKLERENVALRESLNSLRKLHRSQCEKGSLSVKYRVRFSGVGVYTKSAYYVLQTRCWWGWKTIAKGLLYHEVESLLAELYSLEKREAAR